MIYLKLILEGGVCWIFGNALRTLGLMAVPVYLVPILRIKIGRPKMGLDYILFALASGQRYMAESTY